MPEATKDSDRPKWTDLFGIAPGFTLGPSSADIAEGSRLRIVQKGAPDICVIVDEVSEEGATVSLTVHPEDMPGVDPELLRYFEETP